MDRVQAIGFLHFLLGYLKGAQEKYGWMSSADQRAAHDAALQNLRAAIQALEEK